MKYLQDAVYNLTQHGLFQMDIGPFKMLDASSTPRHVPVGTLSECGPIGFSEGGFVNFENGEVRNQWYFCLWYTC